jgi:hypothetical protein
MVPVWVPEQFLRETYAGWRVPGTEWHRGRLCFVWEKEDGVALPAVGMTVPVRALAGWLRATNHDPGDEDRSE